VNITVSRVSALAMLTDHAGCQVSRLSLTCHRAQAPQPITDRRWRGKQQAGV